MFVRAVFASALLLLDFGCAQGADIAAGLTSARTLCVSCHFVEPGDGREKTVVDGIPSFMAIAERSGQTEADVKVFMLKPHPPMPKVQLTTHELDNLASYIMSLKGRR